MPSNSQYRRALSLDDGDPGAPAVEGLPDVEVEVELCAPLLLTELMRESHFDHGLAHAFAGAVSAAQEVEQVLCKAQDRIAAMGLS
jgi:hypothetical protein